MQYIHCPKCENKMLVMKNIELKEHDDRLGGVSIVFKDKNIESNIIYNVKITYNCINCECDSYYYIKNHKGLVTSGFKIS